MILLLIGLLAAGCDRQKATSEQAGPIAAAQAKGLDRSQKGKQAPLVTFRNPDGDETSLAEFRGKPLLVNLWASWCAPCVKELPTLQTLETAQASDGRLKVIAVSQDMAPRGSVEAFLAERDLGRFAAFHDPDMALSTALGAQILPTTILYDASGKEVWRYVGDLDWTGAEATDLLAEVR